MLLSTNTDTILKKGFSESQMLEMLSDTGFTAADFSFFDPKFYDENSENSKKSYYENLRKTAEDKGIVFNQAHAPFHSSSHNQAETERRFNEIVRSMRNAAALGIKNIVVHPCQHLIFAENGNPEKLYEINMVFYNRLKSYCEEYGIKIAVENMWQMTKGGTINHSTCSKPSEFIKYVDSLDKRWFTACLDIGHAQLVREDPADFIRTLGKERLTALHVHDVSENEDSHTLPLYRNVDWTKVCGALGEIGYTGDFTYEAGNFLNPLPNEVIPSALKMMGDVGKYLISKIEY